MLTRDSWFWFLGFLAAAVGYLITTQTPPTLWGYLDWLNAVAFVLAYLLGRMSASPLAGAKDKLADTKTVFGIFSVKE